MKIDNQIFGNERALYGIKNSEVVNCSFSGKEDGESAMKETFGLKVSDCTFELRYPLWHTTKTTVDRSAFTETCRAPFWYDKNISINDSTIKGTKALRESVDISIKNTVADSEEFAWKCNKISINDLRLKSMYPFFESSEIRIDKLELEGKYSFQYSRDVEIKNSVFKTKDAFWHASDVVVADSVIDGEYIGWYSENLKFVRCRISGTQPFCYCKNLILEDCELINCDLAFERSDVHAKINSTIDSVKNPLSGEISCFGIGEVINDLTDVDCNCKITVNNR